jgi:hypothetical protein
VAMSWASAVSLWLINTIFSGFMIKIERRGGGGGEEGLMTEMLQGLFFDHYQGGVGYQ